MMQPPTRICLHNFCRLIIVTRWLRMSSVAAFPFRTVVHKQKKIILPSLHPTMMSLQQRGALHHSRRKHVSLLLSSQQTTPSQSFTTGWIRTDTLNFQETAAPQKTSCRWAKDSLRHGVHLLGNPLPASRRGGTTSMPGRRRTSKHSRERRAPQADPRQRVLVRFPQGYPRGEDVDGSFTNGNSSSVCRCRS